MAGISSRAIGKMENKRGFNGNELQSKEFSDGSGLDAYDFNARTYDQQVGRFLQVDPLSEEGDQESLAPYHFGFNNPVRYDDPDGKCPNCVIGAILGAAVDYGTQVAAKLVQGKSVSESLTDVDGKSILASAALGAVTSGASALAGTTKAVVTIGVKANQVSKAQKAVVSATTVVKKVTDRVRNPDGSRGKPDHQEKVHELTKKAREEAGPGEQVITEKKIQGHESTRRPDVQIVDETGKTRKVFEAERKPNSKRNQAREAEYRRLGVTQETHKVGSK